MNTSLVNKVNAEMSDMNEAIRNNREKQAQAERQIQSLGPDMRAKLAEIKLTMEEDIQAGRGNFPAYSDHLNKIAKAEEDAKDRAAAWSIWHSCRKVAKDLEEQREKVRVRLDAAYRAR